MINMFLNLIQIQEQRLRRQNKLLLIKNAFNIELTDFQLKSLLYEDEEKLYIYEQQKRREGTSTALLLKVFKNIFIDNKLNDVVIFSSTSTSSRILKQGMLELINISNKNVLVFKHSRFEIHLKNNVNIYFCNRKIEGIRGFANNKDFFIDDYDDQEDERFLNDLTTFLPNKIHIFQKGSDQSQWHY